jgi:hypothetical protein
MLRLLLRDAAYQGLEEEAIREVSGLRTQLANRERLFERLLNFAFVLLPHPDQHQRRIAGRECLLRGLHDRAIQAIAVRERSCRREREEHERCCSAYFRSHVAVPGHSAPPVQHLLCSADRVDIIL